MASEAKNKIGIICDNYKVRKYKRELKKLGFDDFEIFPFKDKPFTTIQVNTDLKYQPAIHKLCNKLERRFGGLNNRQN